MIPRSAIRWMTGTAVPVLIGLIAMGPIWADEPGDDAVVLSMKRPDVGLVAEALPGDDGVPTPGERKSGDPAALPLASPAFLVPCRLIRVIDGDTIRVEYQGREQSVRYIGIDTPETVHPSRPVESYGPEASSYNRQLLSSGMVYLSFDLEKRDHYGRLLAYVYSIHENRRVFVNLELVRAGFARARAYPPNVAYASLYERTADNARTRGVGIWHEDPDR